MTEQFLVELRRVLEVVETQNPTIKLSRREQIFAIAVASYAWERCRSEHGLCAMSPDGAIAWASTLIAQALTPPLKNHGQYSFGPDIGSDGEIWGPG